MKIYKHIGQGYWIGSVVIVAAKDSRQAKKVIRKYLDGCGLNDEELNVSLVKINELPGIIYSENGEY